MPSDSFEPIPTQTRINTCHPPLTPVALCPGTQQPGLRSPSRVWFRCADPSPLDEHEDMAYILKRLQADLRPALHCTSTHPWPIFAYFDNNTASVPIYSVKESSTLFVRRCEAERTRVPFDPYHPHNSLRLSAHFTVRDVEAHSSCCGQGTAASLPPSDSVFRWPRRNVPIGEREIHGFVKSCCTG